MSLDKRIGVLGDIRGATDAQCQEHGALLRLRDQRDAKTLIECGSDGFVRLVDHMGDDRAIVQAARVSYGAGTKTVSDDRSLIRYLMRHHHTTPFEMVEFKFHVRVPMDCWRQWIRHRTASVNEYSTRYSEAIDSMQTTDRWRVQATDNKQGSADGEVKWPEGFGVESQLDLMTAQEYLSHIETRFQHMARDIYEERLRFGVAREQARKVLPLSTYTEAYWKCDAHNLLHFLELRLDKHAQLEIRTYANAIAELIKPIIPIAWEAFEDYRLRGMVLSYAEQQEIRQALHPKWAVCKKVLSSRERTELETKMEWLGIPPLSFPSNEELAS